jgi:hypothetical protein
MMIRASPAPRIRAKSSSRNATRNAPASRRIIKIAEIMVASVQAQEFSAIVATRLSASLGGHGRFRQRRTLRATVP